MELNRFKTTRKKIPLTEKEWEKIKKIIKREVKKRKINIKELNVILVGADRIKKLNKKFLNRDKKTDVISFNLGETGEVYICSDYVKNKKDFLKLLFHGFLHILGFDHKSEKERITMKKMEESLIKNII